MNKLSQTLVFLIIIIISLAIGEIVFHKQKTITTSPVNFSEIAEKAEDISAPDIKEEKVEKVEHEGQNFVKQEEDKEKNTEESIETDWQWVERQKKLYELPSTEITQF